MRRRFFVRASPVSVVTVLLESSVSRRVLNPALATRFDIIVIILIVIIIPPPATAVRVPAASRGRFGRAGRAVAVVVLVIVIVPATV